MLKITVISLPLCSTSGCVNVLLDFTRIHHQLGSVNEGQFLVNEARFVNNTTVLYSRQYFVTFVRITAGKKKPHSWEAFPADR